MQNNCVFMQERSKKSMGDHRMMSKSIILTDNFLDMPTSTQNLYFYFLLSGDDDGIRKGSACID